MLYKIHVLTRIVLLDGKHKNGITPQLDHGRTQDYTQTSCSTSRNRLSQLSCCVTVSVWTTRWSQTGPSFFFFYPNQRYSFPEYGLPPLPGFIYSPTPPLVHKHAEIKCCPPPWPPGRWNYSPILLTYILLHNHNLKRIITVSSMFSWEHFICILHKLCCLF